MNRSLVTGGQGFIGGHLVRALLERGDDVTVLDLRGAPGRALEIHGLPVRCGWSKAMSPTRPPFTGPFARPVPDPVRTRSFTSPPRPWSARPPRIRSRTFRANAEGTWTILEAAREAGVGAVVVASSDKAYGPSDSLPYRESDELRPAAPYEAQQGRRRRDLPQLLAGLRPAGRGDPPRQRLRRW